MLVLLPTDSLINIIALCISQDIFLGDKSRMYVAARRVLVIDCISSGYFDAAPAWLGSRGLVLEVSNGSSGFRVKSPITHCLQGLRGGWLSRAQSGAVSPMTLEFFVRPRSRAMEMLQLIRSGETTSAIPDQHEPYSEHGELDRRCAERLHDPEDSRNARDQQKRIWRSREQKVRVSRTSSVSARESRDQGSRRQSTRGCFG